KGLSLDVRENEIVGLAGVDGNGQTELIEAIAGLRKTESGSIILNNESTTNLSPRKITERGLAHVPQDRHKLGLVLDYSISENVALQTYYQKPFSKSKILKYDKINAYAGRIVDEYDVRTRNSRTKAGSRSGGTQHKGRIGRDEDRCPDLLIATPPTRGLDVGAIDGMHEKREE